MCPRGRKSFASRNLTQSTCKAIDLVEMGIVSLRLFCVYDVTFFVNRRCGLEKGKELRLTNPGFFDKQLTYNKELPNSQASGRKDNIGEADVMKLRRHCNPKHQKVRVPGFFLGRGWGAIGSERATSPAFGPHRLRTAEPRCLRRSTKTLKRGSATWPTLPSQSLSPGMQNKEEKASSMRRCEQLGFELLHSTVTR